MCIPIYNISFIVYNTHTLNICVYIYIEIYPFPWIIPILFLSSFENTNPCFFSTKTPRRSAGSVPFFTSAALALAVPGVPGVGRPPGPARHARHAGV